MERINISGSFGISGEAKKSSSINNDEDPDQFQNLLNDISGHIESAWGDEESAKEVAPTPEPLKTYRPEKSDTNDPLYALHQLQIQLLDAHLKPKPPVPPAPRV